MADKAVKLSDKTKVANLITGDTVLVIGQNGELKRISTADFINEKATEILSIIKSNLKIGGRNLLRGTATGKNWDCSRKSNGIFETDAISIESYITNGTDKFSLYSGQNIIVSFECKATANMKNMDVYLLGTGSIVYKGNISVPEVWTKQVHYFTGSPDWGTINAPTLHYLRIDNNCSTDGNVSTLYVRNMKLEIGDIPTDWVPAPEDMINS